MAKRKYATIRAAHNIYQAGREAKRIFTRMRHKRRRTGPHTKTIDKTMRSTATEVSKNFQVSDVKKFSKAKPQDKDFFELYNLQTAVQQDATTLVTNQGRQSVNAVNYWMQFDQIGTLTDAYSGTNDHGRTYFHSCSYEMLATNQSNWQIIVDIYDLIATPNVRYNISTAWALAGQVSASGVGMGEIANTGNITGVRPSDLPAFAKQWKTYAHNRVYLNPGEVWIHKCFRFINRKFKNQELLTSFGNTVPDLYIPGLSAGCLVLMQGVPVHDAVHNVTTSGNQELAIATSYRMRYSVIPETVSGELLNSGNLLPINLSGLQKMETETDDPDTLKNA